MTPGVAILNVNDVEMRSRVMRKRGELMMPLGTERKGCRWVMLEKN